jgi:hypothetical protein
MKTFRFYQKHKWLYVRSHYIVKTTSNRKKHRYIMNKLYKLKVSTDNHWIQNQENKWTSDENIALTNTGLYQWSSLVVITMTTVARSSYDAIFTRALTRSLVTDFTKSADWVTVASWNKHQSRDNTSMHVCIPSFAKILHCMYRAHKRN